MSATRSATNYNSKFFDINTTEVATKTEPSTYMIGDGDIMDSVRDGRLDTGITLSPTFTDAGVKPDGNMEEATGWSATNCSVATDSSLYIVGTGSVKMTWTNSGSQATATIEKTFTEFSINSNKLCWFAMYMSAANMAEAPITGMSITITDASAVTKTVAITADIYNNLFADTNYMSDTWRYFIADMSGHATLDYANITKVKISITVGAGTGTTPEVNVDGIRFGPADCDFVYEYDEAFIPSMILLNGLTCKRYNLLHSVDGVTYTSFASSDALTTSFLQYFESITTAKSYFKFTLGFANQSGGLGITVANILILEFLYEFDIQPRCVPIKANTIEQSENKHGAMSIDKMGSHMEFALTFDAFTPTQQTDLDFLETLFDRKTPFWFWLNGNNANSSYRSLSSPWKKENLYYVQDATGEMQLGHLAKLADKNNATNEISMKFIESAYKRVAV